MKHSRNSYFNFVIFLFGMIFLAGCSAASASSSTPLPVESTEVIPQPSKTIESLITESQPNLTATPSVTATTTPSPTSTAIPIPTATATVYFSPTPDTRPDPARWAEWPVIPTVSARAYEIYLLGQELGNDPHSFSRIGDCESAPEAFLGFYTSDFAWLQSDYQYLSKTINQFYNSFGRQNATVGDGWWPADLFSRIKADPTLCDSNETPLECEYRRSRPSFVFIAMGTNGANASIKFEQYLRQTVEFLTDHGIVPILMTKADNLEGDNSINKAIARVAHDYDVPLYNFWLAAHRLPGDVLEDDNAHLTTEAEDTRNFYGLMTLDTIWNTLQSWGQPTAVP
jgi:hypothetical protein